MPHNRNYRFAPASVKIPKSWGTLDASLQALETGNYSGKGNYQTIANNLPREVVLICQAEKKERIPTLLERVAVFFRQQGRFVRVLPYLLI